MLCLRSQQLLVLQVEKHQTLSSQGSILLHLRARSSPQRLMLNQRRVFVETYATSFWWNGSLRRNGRLERLRRLPKVRLVRWAVLRRDQFWLALLSRNGLRFGVWLRLRRIWLPVRWLWLRKPIRLSFRCVRLRRLRLPRLWNVVAILVLTPAVGRSVSLILELVSVRTLSNIFRPIPFGHMTTVRIVGPHE